MAQQYATLTKTNVGKIETLEKDLHCCLLAVEPKSFAKLSEAQLKKVQALEKELKTVVLAYNC